jgi:hypothetical protein
MNKTAANMATSLMCTMHQAHRGAVATSLPGIVAAFGNDDYSSDDRTKAEVARLRELLAEEGIEELGFGIDMVEGYTWVLLAKTDEKLLLHELVWRAAREAWIPDGSPKGISYLACQEQIAIACTCGQIVQA